MDKNTLAGLLVVGLILLGFSWWNGEQNKKYAEQRRVADSIALASMPEPVAEGPVAEVAEDKTGTGDSLRRVRIGDILADAEIAAPQELTFSNAVMDVKFDTRGARVDNVVLKDYKKYGSDEPVTMYEDGSSHFGMQFWLAGDQFIDTSDYTFEFAGEEAMEGGRRIIFELPVDSAGRVRYIYTMFDDDYMMDFDVQFVDMEGRLSNRMSSLMFDWGLTTQQQEKGFTNENNYSYLAWNTPGERKPDESGKRKDDSATETVTGNVQWIAMKQQFFTTTFVSRGNFQNPELTYETFKPGSGLIKRYTAQANVAYNRSQADYGFRIYFGPVEYRRLKSYDMGMERLVGLGWSFARWVNVWLVIPVFNFLMRHIESMGLIILLLTVMIRLIILPLTYKSYLSTAKMRILRPELDQINERYPKQEDAMKKQQATMELYRKAGVSPMGGCLPALIQMPFIVALFFLFPTAIELRGQSFLWAEDLSNYDSILSLPFNIPWYGDHVSLFTLLMAVAFLINTRLTSKSQPSGPGAGMMKMMMYLMPIMFLLWFNNYASGLSYYYFLSSVISIVMTWGMKLAVNDDKLHAAMKAAAAKKTAASKGKGKSKWQQRYEEAVRQQQQMRKK